MSVKIEKANDAAVETCRATIEEDKTKGQSPPSAPSISRPPPPPYTPFYSEPKDEGFFGSSSSSTRSDPSPRRCHNNSGTCQSPAGRCHNNTASSLAQHGDCHRLGRRSSRCHEPVLVSPLVLTPQIHTIPLTVENMQYHEDSASSGGDQDEVNSDLGFLKSLDHVQLTRETGEGGVDFCLRNSKGDRILTASDEVGCTGNLLGKNRPFDLTVCDAAFTEVFTLKRPFSCNSRIFPVSLPRVAVSTPSSGVIGVVKMRWALFEQHLTVHDARSSSSTPICHVMRRNLPIVARGANEFKIFDPSGKVQIGKIHSRQTSVSASSGMKPNEDRLAISFPKSLEPRVKATLIGALFLLRELCFRP